MRTNLVVVVGLVILLAGCGGRYDRIMPPSSDRIHTVVAGENLYTIGKRYFVSTVDLVEANRLKAPYRLKAGQRLHIPILRKHTVVSGETLSGIAELYRVSLYALAQLNNLRTPYKILAGSKLRLPSSHFKVASRTDVKPVPKAVDVPKKPRRIRPREGDLRVTETVMAPLPKSLARSGRVRPKPRRVSLKKSVSGGQHFIWPLTGRIVSVFGSKAQGIRNDGVNIATRPGTPVRAIGHGTVVYAGDKLSSFGNLLIIRHPNGWRSAYAHNEALLVEQGEDVRQGQVIARSGKTGIVKEGQLHLEIRKGAVPVNPLDYLRR